jgi:fumarate reductase iron-sulfur subunit
MRITIRKSDGLHTYDVASLKVTTLLAALYEIKAKTDPSLTFGAGCRSGVCGACAVRVNGRETLACAHTPTDGDLIEPLKHHPILRDLKVDKLAAQQTLGHILKKEELHGNTDRNFPPLSPREEENFRLQSDCILCDSCYSSCPVLAVNPDFLGPFALSRTLRYLSDPRYSEIDERQATSRDISSRHMALLEKIQKNGIWDCTMCGECTAVCPQGIDPKGDIMQLRGESLKAGYSDPSFAIRSFGAPDLGFGPGPGGF